MPRPTDTPTPNAIIQYQIPTSKGCHFNHPKESSKLKFFQEVGCPALSKHAYICWKDVTALAKVVDRFNTKFPRITDHTQENKPVAKRISDESSSNQVSSRRVH